MTRLAARLGAGLSALSLLAFAGAAFAAPTVNVTVGAELAKKTKHYGARDVEQIRSDLQREVERALARKGAAQPTSVDLVLENAVPNRPTFAQLTRLPGLSLQSVGVGGAKITGSVTEADGVVRPIRYQWFQNDIRQEIGATTWTDAQRAFNLLADRVAKGRPADKLGPGAAADGLFGSWSGRYF